MTWISLALLAPLFWASSNFVDKYILGKHTLGIADFLFFSTLTSWFLFLGLVIFKGIPAITVDSWIPILTGMALIYSYGFYGKALQVSDTSTLVVFFKLIPVTTLVLGFIFLGQTISASELLGFIVVLCGATILSFEPGKPIITKGLAMIMVAILIWSVMTLVIDYSLTKIEFWDYFTLDTLGSALAGPTLLLLPSTRREVLNGVKVATPKKYLWFTVNNLLDFFGQMSIKKALAIAPSVGLVTVVMQAQSFYAILIGCLLTILVPDTIKEDISLHTLTKKVVAAIIMFSGVYIIVQASG